MIKNNKIKYFGIILIIIGGITLFIGIKKIVEIKKLKNQGEELAKKIVLDKSDEYIKQKINFDELKKRNGDAKAWIYLPGTNINQAIFQEKVVGEYYYLSHDIDKNYRVEGSLFFPKAVDENDKGYRIVFGHLMNKTIYGDFMFTMLRDFYENKEIALDKYSTLYIYEEDVTFEYKILAAKETLDEDDIYIYPKKKGSSEYENMLSNIKKSAIWSTDDKIDKDKDTLILSTCDSFENTHKRFFVIFKINRIYYPNKGMIDNIN